MFLFLVLLCLPTAAPAVGALAAVFGLLEVLFYIGCMIWLLIGWLIG